MLPTSLRFNRGGKKLFLQACILMMLIRLGLLLLPFRQLQSLILKVNQRKVLTPVSPDITTWDIAVAVRRSTKYSLNVKCLAKALTTGMLMTTYDLPYKINIGVAKGDCNNLEAHAWVMSEGKVVVGYIPDLARYVTMTSKGEGLVI